jgi:predicted DNA-binding antitoxin AbrB/MazE fold protein
LESGRSAVPFTKHEINCPLTTVRNPHALLRARLDDGMREPNVLDSESMEEVMSVVALEGIVEKGVIRPLRPLVLAEGAKVYIVVPEAEPKPGAIESPRLVHPEQAADFRMEVSEV